MFPFVIARRYFFSRGRHHATGVIATISMLGVALAAMAMVVTLSVFNGFVDMVAGLFTTFDPVLKVVPAVGKTVEASDSTLQAIRRLPGVEGVTEVLEDQALVATADHQWVVVIKGVEDDFVGQPSFGSILYGDGEPVLRADVLDYGIMGLRLASQMGLGTHYDGALRVYAPRGGERLDMTNPARSFRSGELYSPGVVFAVGQSTYDARYIVTSLDFARRLFDRPAQVSALELRVAQGVSVGSLQRRVRQVSAGCFEVLDRYEQQADTFRIMQIEKFVAWLFLSFILLVAAFNIIGSLGMLMVDKRDDMQTLRALGASDTQLRRIFLLEGWMISLSGALLGIVVGLLLCWVQHTFGVVPLGTTEGAFVSDAYPVVVHLWDILLTLVTVLVTTFVVIWWPTRRMALR